MTAIHRTSSRVAPILTALLMVGACTRTTQLGPLTTDAQSVELAGAKSVGVNISLGAGELVLTGGSDKLLDAQFTRNTGLLKPEVSYGTAGDRGTLSLRQPSENGSVGQITSGRSWRYKWDLKLNRNVPTDLNIDMGAGKINLTLAGMNLSSVKVNLGAGAGDIDLTGDWSRDLDVSLKGGVGSAHVHLPSKVGVKVDVEGGIGTVDAYGFQHTDNTYTNDMYGKSPVTVRVHIEAGIGAVNLELEK